MKTPNSFSFTAPYDGCWLEHFYRRGAIDLFGEKAKTEDHFRQLIARGDSLPELQIFGNFIVERHAICALCHELDIDTVCTEDGFFPHYETMHVDPLGFAWESSLSRTLFRSLSDGQRIKVSEWRDDWRVGERMDLPPDIQRPFVLWPLQLIGDKVNHWDLNVTDWLEMLVHFRQSLPSEYQLVIKQHPRAKVNDLPKQGLSELPNSCLVPWDCSLPTLIEESSAVAGANSTVLLEARLCFHKPVYHYGRGWFTNHSALFTPVYLHMPSRGLNRFEWVEDRQTMRSEWLDDYTDWFLFQLLARQIDHQTAGDWNVLKRWMEKRTYNAFLSYGEEIFNEL